MNDPERFPLEYGLEQSVSAHFSEIHLLITAAVLFTMPVIVLLFFAQRPFVRGINTTGLNG